MPIVTGVRGVGYHTVMPYITVPNPEDFVRFAKDVFGAEETFKVLNTDGKGTNHYELRVGDSVVMCGGGGSVEQPKLVLLHTYVPDVDTFYRRALDAGAETVSRPEDKPYGERNAGIKDPAGNQWYIATRLGGAATPEGFRMLTPYIVRPDAEGLIEFLKKAFGARQEFVMKSPEGKIMHSLVWIGDSAVEIGDADRTSSAFIMDVPNADEVYNQALAAGAKSLFAPETFHWGVRMGGVEDPWGNTWTISTELQR